MGIPGGWELILIILAILLIFGAKKIPEFGKGLGVGIKNFKNALKSEEKNSSELEEKNTKEKNK